MRLLAQTVPPPVWLDELRWSAGRMELEGKTLQPDALQPWVQQLSKHALLQGQQLSAVKVERLAEGKSMARAGEGLAVGSAVAEAVADSVARPRQVWSFTLASTAPKVASSAAATQNKEAAR